MANTKKSNLKKAVIATLTTVAVAGLIVGVGDGEITLTQVDESRTIIEVVTPPKGMDSNNYEIYYKDTKFGSAFYRTESTCRSSCGVTVLTSLLDNKSNFTVKFYNGSVEVGSQKLSKFKDVRVASAAVLLNNLDLRLRMKSLTNFQIYSTNAVKSESSNVSDTDMTIMIFPAAQSSPTTSEFIENNLLWLDQWNIDNKKVNCSFSYSEQRFNPKNLKQLFLYSNQINPTLVADIPDVNSLVSGGVGVLFDQIPNNTVRAGNDIYDLNGAFYTADNIIASRMASGQSDLKIWYKINDKWFDLLNSKYKDSSYFDSESNAISDSDVNAWKSEVLKKTGGLYYNQFDKVSIVDEIEILK